MITPLSRYTGCMLGLAAGDALGTTVEFKTRGSFRPVTDIVGGGPFGLKKGEWTDDTSMALCLAESLCVCAGFDARDQIERFLKWRETGYLSSNGICFDVGTTISAALHRYARTRDPYAGSTQPSAAGNGSLMRLAPVPLYFAADPRRAIELSAESSRTTHGTRMCLDACRYFSGLILGALEGCSKKELLSECFTPVAGLWEQAPLCPEIDEIACGAYTQKPSSEIIGSGYVVKSLEAALWAFSSSSTFEEGALLAVNLGDDADTTGAIYGQLAGAYYGETGIPESWRSCLAMKETIDSMAQRLFNERYADTSHT